MNKGLIVANWKLNGDYKSVMDFSHDLSRVDSENSFVFAPPSVYLASIKKEFPQIITGAQSASDKNKGAFTGEVSMNMLADIGCKYVLVGHSERRTLFAETNDMIFQQTRSAIDAGLTPILCIGETDTENKTGKTEQVLSEQIGAVTKKIDKNELKKVVIAYEPVWAIGTGRTPNCKEINEIHQKIRSIFASNNDTIAAAVKILYGGSVKPDNAKDIFSCEHVDGGLVGGASLDIESFKLIIQAYK